jgi:hypothetical protein
MRSCDCPEFAILTASTCSYSRASAETISHVPSEDMWSATCTRSQKSTTLRITRSA